MWVGTADGAMAGTAAGIIAGGGAVRGYILAGAGPTGAATRITTTIITIPALITTAGVDIIAITGAGITGATVAGTGTGMAIAIGTAADGTEAVGR